MNAGELEYEFVPFPAGRGHPALDPARFEGALLAVGVATPPTAIRAARRALPGRPLGGLVTAPDARELRQVGRLGLDFVVEAWRPSDPLLEAVLAHVAGARRPPARGGNHSSPSRTTARRLAILTDVVKTANSILEPRKVIELVVEKIRELIPSEAWSLMMVDEEKQELVFEAAVGAKARDVSAVRLKIGEGVAGWVAQTGKPAIVNDAARDPRFSARVDRRVQFETRSILCAPLVSRGRTIGRRRRRSRIGGGSRCQLSQYFYPLREYHRNYQPHYPG